MKIKVIPLIIVLGLAALMAYGLFSFCKNDNALLLAIVGGIMLFVALTAAFGVSFEPHRTSVNIKVTSIVFFLLALISNVIFAFVQFSVPLYIVINGLLLLIWLLIVYGINRGGQ